MLDIPLVNLGAPGASNIELLYNILNYQFNTDDIVVAMWSLPMRDLQFTEVDRFTQLGMWNFKKLFTPDSEQDYVIKSWICIHHGDLFLKHKNLKYIHYPSSPWALEKFKPQLASEITNLHLDGMPNLDKAADNEHLGIKSHKATAEIIYRIINEK
jgi:hypothetical protein